MVTIRTVRVNVFIAISDMRSIKREFKCESRFTPEAEVPLSTAGQSRLFSVYFFVLEPRVVRVKLDRKSLRETGRRNQVNSARQKYGKRNCICLSANKVREG